MKYIKGSGSIPGIPARDLNEADIEKHVLPVMAAFKIKGKPKEWLASTGLYEPDKKKIKPILEIKKDGE